MSVKIHKTLQALWGGEVFYEWIKDVDVFFMAPLDDFGQLNLTRVNLFGCPYDNVHGDNIPVYDPRNPDNTTYRPGCSSPFVFDSDRLVYAAYLSAQLKPHRTLIFDGGVRLQHGPWGSVPYKPHFLYSGAAVWNFYKDLYLKANYATGFRPPVFNATSGSAPGGNYGGNPDIRTEESRAVKAELNAKIIKNKKRIRRWSVRVNYSYTTLLNMIRLVGGRYHNSTEKALHAVEFISDLYLEGGHRFALSYTYVRQHGSSHIDGGMFRAVPNHWATAGAVFNLLTRKNLRLDVNVTARFIGPFEDPNRILICSGNECQARMSDMVWDRMPPVALLNAGLRLRIRAGKKPMEFSANFYNILDAKYWTSDVFQDLQADVEMQPGGGQRFHFFLQAKMKL
jgi:outer membrane receptor protein involved in Fe transport